MEAKLRTVCAAGALLAAFAPWVQAVERGAGLVIELRPMACEVVVGEPLVVAVAVRNTSEEEAVANTGTLNTTMKYLCSYEGGAFEERGHAMPRWSAHSGARVYWGYSRPVRLGPGQACTEYWNILMTDSGLGAKGGCVFDRPGMCKVKVGAYQGKEWLESDEVPVTVKPIPSGHREAALILNEIGALGGQTGGSISLDMQSQLGKFVADYPDTMYADHARYALGHQWRLEPGRNVEIAAKSWSYLDAVTPRIGGLRLMALLDMAELLTGAPAVADPERKEDLLAELDGYRSLAREMGLDERLAELEKKLGQTN